MAWVRIHDGAMTHPKIVGLADKPFRLWVWGLSYCQSYLTDGAIVPDAVPARLKRAITDLEKKGLWEKRGTGYAVHDYLDWNDSKDLVQKKRSEAKERMTNARHRTSREVLRRCDVGVGSSVSEGKPDLDLGNAAARFCDRFQALYSKHRNGAHYHVKPSLDWNRVVQLLGTWDESRLEKIAVILLTTDDEWVSRTDRGIGVLVAKATWCDDRLKAWEAEHGVSA